MERDNFRIIKSLQELYDVKYIRKKALIVRVPESKSEFVLEFDKVKAVDTELYNTEVYTVLIDGKYDSEFPSMYEAVDYISSVINAEESAEGIKKNKKKKITGDIVNFVITVIAFAIAYALVDLILK